MKTISRSFFDDRRARSERDRERRQSFNGDDRRSQESEKTLFQKHWYLRDVERIDIQKGTA